MSSSMLYSQIWTVSIYLAIASIVAFSGLVIKRSFSQRQMEGNNKLRREATRIAIRWMESEETTPYFRDLNGRKRRMLISVVAELIPTIRGDVRTKMVRFIELLGGVEALTKSVRSSKPDTRLIAVSLLQYFDSPLALEALHLRLSDPIFAIRAEAAVALQSGPQSLAFQETVDALGLKDREPQLFDYKVFRAMAKENLASLIASGPTHTSSRIRMLSAHGMGSSGDFSLFFVLSTMVDDQDEFVRAEVIHSLGALNHPHASDLLESAMSDHSWRVRAAAADSIGVIGLELSGALSVLLESEVHWWVRYRIEEAMNKLDRQPDPTEDYDLESREQSCDLVPLPKKSAL